MRVLILEDDPELANQIASMLRDENHAVDVIDDGEEGLAYGLENDYDAVILDPGLPTTAIMAWESDEGGAFDPGACSDHSSLIESDHSAIRAMAALLTRAKPRSS